MNRENRAHEQIAHGNGRGTPEPCLFHKTRPTHSSVWERFFSISPSPPIECVPHPNSHIRWAFQLNISPMRRRWRRWWQRQTQHQQRQHTNCIFDWCVFFISPVYLSLSLDFQQPKRCILLLPLLRLVCWFHFDFSLAITKWFLLCSALLCSLLSLALLIFHWCGHAVHSDNEIFTLMIHRHCV